MTAPRLTALGGAREVGANAFLLEIDSRRLLLDAGTHPRHSGLASLPRLAALPDLDAIFITHAHLDHVGALPIVARAHPRARIYWSRSTEAAALRQLHATVSVMRRKLEEGKGGEVLFEHDLVDELLWKTWPLEPEQTLRLDGTSGVEVTAFSTGHLLGGTGVVVAGAAGRVAYTGDFCGHARELQDGLEAPDLPIDTLIVEGTYGATPGYRGSDYPLEVERFARDVAAILAGGGSVLIPVFALGRTQEMLALIKRLRGQGAIPRTPLYTSGLGRTFSEIHDRQRQDPWLHRFRWRFEPAAEVLESWHLDELDRLLREPSIYLLTSGMMIENTMSARLAERLVPDPRHAVFFVGYVDPEELGQRVLAARPGDWVEFHRGLPMTRVATPHIRRYYFSAHADREEILDLCRRWNPRHVVFVHGDPDALAWLASEVESRSGGRQRATIPEIGRTIDL